MSCCLVGDGSGRRGEGVIPQANGRLGRVPARFTKPPCVAYLADDEGKQYLRGGGWFYREKKTSKKMVGRGGAFISRQKIDNESGKR